MFSDVFQARTKACKRNVDDCCNVKLHLHNTQSYVVGSQNVSTESILVKIVRPNLNPYQGWSEVNLLRKGAKARFLRFCLDSVALMPLVNRSLLFRALSNSYNRCIEPSQKPIDKKFQSIVHYEKEAVLSEQEKYEIVL